MSSTDRNARQSRIIFAVAAAVVIVLFLMVVQVAVPVSTRKATKARIYFNRAGIITRIDDEHGQTVFAKAYSASDTKRDLAEPSLDDSRSISFDIPLATIGCTVTFTMTAALYSAPYDTYATYYNTVVTGKTIPHSNPFALDDAIMDHVNKALNRAQFAPVFEKVTPSPKTLPQTSEPCRVDIRLANGTALYAVAYAATDDAPVNLTYVWITKK